MKNLNIMSVKLVREKTVRYETKIVRSPEDAFNIIEQLFQLSEQAEEHMVMLAMSTKNEVLGAFEISHGGINSTVADPKNIFKRALLANASSFIIAHNHPSGDTKPSMEDIKVTKRLKEAGEILSIQLLDHLIIGDHFISLKEKGHF